MSQIIDPYERAKSQRRRRNTAFLRRHWRVAAPLIIIAAVALFVLPWLFLPMIVALCWQAIACMGVYLLARSQTTAFHPEDED